jgi:hypothetical protein
MGENTLSWFKQAKIGMSNEELSDKLKNVVRTNAFFARMFKTYGIPIEDVDKLRFEVMDLDGKFAQSDSKTIYLNETLFEKDSFFKENLHFFVHEMIHWLTRQKEQEFYFADPEEIEAFSSQMAFEILRGKGKQEIAKVFFPIIKSHFDEEQDANKLFEALFAKAILRSNE